MSSDGSLPLKVIYLEISNILKEAGIDTFDLDARIIIEKHTIYDWSYIIACPNSLVTKGEYDYIIADIKQRVAGKPLSRIYGSREFWGLEFQISKDTLDPRPDTELIIERALTHFPKDNNLRILDLGTGSGCILIALLHEYSNATGVGVDLSAGAIEIAKTNAENNNCEGRSEFTCSSWFDSIIGKFDLIVSNPPYISNEIIPTLAKEVRNHDPILALDGGDDGLNPYKIIFPSLKNYLKSTGIALFEIGYDQEKTVTRLAEESGFTGIEVHRDLAGNPRVVDMSYGDK